MELTTILNDLLLQGGQERALVDALTDTARLRARVAELEKARGEIESVSNAKSESLTVIAHELRTPMSGLIGMADLLLNTDLTRGTARLPGNRAGFRGGFIRVARRYPRSFENRSPQASSRAR